MLTHLCPSLVIPPHRFECCLPRPRPQPRATQPHARPRGKRTIAKVLCMKVQKMLEMSFWGQAVGDRCR